MKLLFGLVGVCFRLFGLHGSDDVEDGEDDAHSSPDVQVRIGACVGKAQERTDDVKHGGGDGSTLAFGIPGGQADDARTEISKMKAWHKKMPGKPPFCYALRKLKRGNIWTINSIF